MLNKLPQGALIDMSDPIGRSLVGCWRFTEGGGGLALDLKKRNNGTLTNGPTWSAGDRGRALTFDGVDDYISWPSVATGNSFSLCLRFKILATPGAYAALAAQDSGTGLYVRNTSGTLQLNYYLAGDHLSTGTLVVGKWYSVVVTVNALGTIFYINGLPSGTAATTTGFNLMRSGSDSSAEKINAIYDQLGLCNRVLTPSEILRLYQDPDCYLVNRRRPLIADISGTGVLAGTATITVIGAGTLAGAGGLSGTTAISVAASGTVTASGSMAGTTSITVGASGAVTGAGVLTGTTVVTLTTSGTLVGSAPATGTSTISLVAAGTLKGATAIVGATTISLSATGTLITTTLAGSTTITVNASGTLTTQATTAIVGYASMSMYSSATLTACKGYYGCNIPDFNYTTTVGGCSSTAYDGYNTEDLGYLS